MQQRLLLFPLVFGHQERVSHDLTPCSPDLNSTEKFWLILKMEVNEERQQFTQNEALWYKILQVARTIPPLKIKILTLSVNCRLFTVITKNCSYTSRNKSFLFQYSGEYICSFRSLFQLIYI